MVFEKPTNGLDPLWNRIVDETIGETRTGFAGTIVVVSHDITSAPKIAELIFLLQKGRPFGEGSPTELVRSRIRLAHQLLDSSAIAAEELLRARKCGGRKRHLDEAPDEPPWE